MRFTGSRFRLELHGICFHSLSVTRHCRTKSPMAFALEVLDDRRPG
jgi:hypothetical protein